MFTVRKLEIVFTVAAMCASTSAFAETRHRDATDGSDDSAQTQRAERHSRDGAQSQSRQQYDNRSASRSDQDRNDNRSQQSRNENRSTTRSDQDQYRNNDRSAARTDQYQYRNDGRSPARVESDRSYGRGSYGNDGRHSYSTHGRVTRVEHYGGGYRVWLGGGYPFFVPEARWRLFPLRVGIDVVLGGYWNPAGYYDAYDYNGPYGYNTSGDLRGVIESVDYRRGTLVLRDDISGNFVTAVLRGNDPRLGDLRPGDYVDLTGEWSRAGVFSAYNVADLRDSGRDDDGYGRDRRY